MVELFLFIQYKTSKTFSDCIIISFMLRSVYDRKRFFFALKHFFCQSLKSFQPKVLSQLAKKNNFQSRSWLQLRLALRSPQLHTNEKKRVHFKEPRRKSCCYSSHYIRPKQTLPNLT